MGGTWSKTRMIQRQRLSLKVCKKLMCDIDLIAMVHPGFKLCYCTRWISRWGVITLLVLPREGAHPHDNNPGIPSPKICVFLYWDASTHFIPSNDTCNSRSYRTTRLLLLPIPKPSWFHLFHPPLIKIGTHRLSTCRHNSLGYRYCIMDLF